jgi:diadenosine tetraphosphate (Ap4A) HIT family hydrolase
VTEEAGDDDFCDVGSVGTPAAAHIHHHVLPPHNQTKNKNKKGGERERERLNGAWKKVRVWKGRCEAVKG